MHLTELQIFSYQLPLKRPLPFSGGTLTQRKGFLIRLTDADGCEGWGEVAPLPGFSPETLTDALRDLRRLSLKMAQFRDTFWFVNWPASVRFGVEWALLEVQAQAQKRSLFARETVPLNALLIGQPAEIRAQAEQTLAKDYRAAKLKVGHRPVAEDLRIIWDVCAILGENCALRLDANRAWSHAEADFIARNLPPNAIAYVEEPLQNPTELPAFQSAHPHLPIALDESLREPIGKKLLQQSFLPAALILKPTLDPQSVFTYASLGIPNVLSSSVESGLGTRALIAMATVLSSPETAIGLDTYNWLAEDVLQSRLALDAPVADCTSMKTVDLNMDRLTPVT